eukprot:CFRG0633T1
MQLLSSLSLSFLLCLGMVAAQTLQWRLVSVPSDSSPPPRSNFGMDYDLARNRLITFGGQNGGLFNDTWAFDLDTSAWSQVITVGSPEPRHSFITGIDRAGDRMLVTVGQGSNGFFGDVWSLDLLTNTWSEVSTTGTPPVPRYAPAGGIFPGGTQMIVSHGFEKTRFDNSFAFDLNTAEWREVTPSGKDSAIPYARCLVGSTMIADGEAVMFGGCGSGGFGPCPGFDTWHLRTSPGSPDKTGLWTQMSSSPAARNRGTLAFMPNINNVVMFGGGRVSTYGGDADGLVNLLDPESGLWTRVFPASVNSQVPTNQGGVMSFADTEQCAYLVTDSMNVWSLCGTSTDGLTVQEGDSFVDWRLVHGILMMLAWGILIPIGVTCAMYRGMFGGSIIWLTIHQACNTSAWLLTIAGFAIALILNSTAKFKSTHSFIGIAIFALVALQPLNGWLRPHLPDAGENKSKKRIAWEIIHKWNGRILFLLGIVNPFLGLYFIGGRSVLTFSFIMYSIWVGLLAIFWLIMPIYLWRTKKTTQESQSILRNAPMPSLSGRPSKTTSARSMEMPEQYSPECRRPVLVEAADV